MFPLYHNLSFAIGSMSTRAQFVLCTRVRYVPRSICRRTSCCAICDLKTWHVSPPVLILASDQEPLPCPYPSSSRLVLIEPLKLVLSLSTVNSSV